MREARATDTSLGRCRRCKAYVAPEHLCGDRCWDVKGCERRFAVAASIDRLVNQEGAPEDAFSREVGREMKPPEPEA